jgi:hypothetical protein
MEDSLYDSIERLQLITVDLEKKNLNRIKEQKKKIYKV